MEEEGGSSNRLRAEEIISNWFKCIRNSICRVEISRGKGSPRANKGINIRGIKIDLFRKLINCIKLKSMLKILSNRKIAFKKILISY